MEDREPRATEWSGHEMASDVSDRIRDVIAAAEAAAGAIRYEAEQQAQSRRRAAEEDARRLVDDARRDAEALLAERIRRISALSDTIIERGEGLLGRISHAEDVRHELESLVAALGESAAQLAREAAAEVEDPSTVTSAERQRPAGDSAGVRGAGADGAAVGTPPVEAARADTAPADSPPVEAPSADSPAAGAPPVEVAPTEAPPADTPAADSPTPEARAAEATTDEIEDAVAVEVEPDDRDEPASIADLPGMATIEDAEVVVEPADGDDDDQMLGARLVALQMAVAGGNRGEVEAHLRQAFHVPDPQSILDDVFGPGTDPSKRVVWPSAADG